MEDRQYTRLTRALNFIGFMLLIVILALLFIALKDSHDDRKLREYIDDRVSAVRLQEPLQLTGQPLEPKEGPKGDRGDVGATGSPGQDSVSTIIERQTTVIDTITETEKGDTGEQGADGRTPEIQFNAETNDVEIRYIGDQFWGVLIPCEKLTVGCGEE